MLLIDTATAAILQVFKGYRDAQCAWLCLQLPARPMDAHASAATASTACQQSVTADTSNAQPLHEAHLNDHHEGPARTDGRQPAGLGAASSASVDRASERRAAGPPGSSDRGASEQLLLAVHAPKRGAVEVWEMTYATRVCSIKTGPDCCMLSAAPVFGRGQQQHHREHVHVERSNQCWMLDCQKGHLWSLEEAVMAAVSKGIPLRL